MKNSVKNFEMNLGNKIDRPSDAPHTVIGITPNEYILNKLLKLTRTGGSMKIKSGIQKLRNENIRNY